mgnify:CR=1 FL=1
MKFTGTRLGFWQGVAAVVAGVGLTACGASGGAPTIGDADVFVGCVQDSNGDYVWDFTAHVDDPEGFEDVASVYVEVYTSSEEDATAIDSIDLDYQSEGHWLATIIESEKPSLDCANIQNFEFDFHAEDLAGNAAEGIIFVP